MTREKLGLGLMELSVIREITNIGLGHATTALAEMTDRPFNMTVPEVEPVPLDEMSRILGSAEELVVAVYMPIEGDLSGHIAFLMPWAAAAALWQRLVGAAPRDPADIDEYSVSAFMEAGNIMNSSFLCAISDAAGISMIARPPTMAIEMAFATLDTIAAEASCYDHVGLSIRTQIVDAGGLMEGHFLYIPSVGGLRRLFDRLGIREAA
jgi:chemotaxis protein CheC